MIMQIRAASVMRKCWKLSVNSRISQLFVIIAWMIWKNQLEFLHVNFVPTASMARNNGYNKERIVGETNHEYEIYRTGKTAAGA